MLIFDAVIEDNRKIILLKTVTKSRVHSKVMSIYLMQRPFSVHKLPLLVLKDFQPTMHYSVMTHMILIAINIFQILNINLLKYLNF